MATYINYGEGDEDALVQGAEWLQRIVQQQRGEDAEQEFAAKFKKAHSEAENRGGYDCAPVFDLFADYSTDLFAAIPETRTEERVREIESFFALVLSMLLLLEDMDHLDRSTMRLCMLFSSSKEQQPELRLRLLMMLYNTFNNPAFAIRYRVFKYTLDYSATANLFDVVVPYLEYLDSWMVDWTPNMQVEDKRVLYRDISGYMRNLGKRNDAFLHMKKYHQLYQGSSAAELSNQDVQNNTLLLLKDALQLPTVIQFDDILAFDSVQAFGKGKHPQKDLVALCTVFLAGEVNDLKEFHKKNGKLFTDNDICVDEAMSKIKLLTLATMVHGKSEIALCEVAQKLQEDDANVEKLVVKALSENVIDGRIDQLNQKVLVKSAFQRKFKKEEWDFLDSKLDTWITNLESVIKFIGDHKTKVAN